MRIGRYELLTELARGGMATLHLARRLGPDQFQRLVAIKRVHEQLSDDPEAMGRFLDEARLAARIVHPNVVQIFDFDRQGGSQYIAMEYVHGVDLMAVFHRAAQAEPSGYHWSHAVRVVAEAAAGLHAAHELVGDDGRPLRLVHRDVSPQNILLSFDGHVKVTDFGIAHAVGQAHKTMVGVVMGKVAYMSPEQCRGLPLDRRSDVFALGVVLHEMVSLRRLFRGDTDQETMQRVVAGHIPSLLSLAPGAPEVLQTLVSRALAQDPQERFQTAAELQNALEQLLVGEGILVNAGILQDLLVGLFPQERADRDAQLAQLYRKTILPGSGDGGFGHQAAPTRPIRAAAFQAQGEPVLNPGAGHGPGATEADDDAACWDDAAAPTIQDTAPPAVLRSSGAFRTRLGFEGAGVETSMETVMPQDRVASEPPVTLEPSVTHEPPVILEPSVTHEPPVTPALQSHNSDGVPRGQDTAMGRAAMPDPRREAATQAPGQGASEPQVGGLGGPTPPMSLASVRPGGRPSSGSSSGSSSQTMSTRSLVASFRRVRWPWLVTPVVLALAGVALLLWMGNRGKRRADGPPGPSRGLAAQENSQGRLPPTSGPQEETVTIRLWVKPPGARLWVGDQEWVLRGEADAVRVIRLPKESEPVVLRLEATGHQTEERLVVPGEVVPGKGDEIDIAMKPLKASPHRRAVVRPMRAPAMSSSRRRERPSGRAPLPAPRRRPIGTGVISPFDDAPSQPPRRSL